MSLAKGAAEVMGTREEKLVPAALESASPIPGSKSRSHHKSLTQFLAFLVTQSWVTTHLSSCTVVEDSGPLV